MRVILFIDLLGARRLWQTGGVQASKEAFDRFTAMVVAASRIEPPGSIISGGIETDAAMLTCESPEVALRIVQRLYSRAFNSPNNPESPRIWLRGSLVVDSGETPLRRQVALGDPLGMVSTYPYSPDALDALSIEKGGYKGMRLLMREEVVTPSLRRALRVPFDDQSFIPIRKLRHSTYPKVVQGELLDYLWMATGNDDACHSLSLQMTQRLRFSNKDPEEFAQAAATQVVFHECAAIRNSVRSRAERARAAMDDYAPG